MSSGKTIPAHWQPKHQHWSEFPETTRVGWRGPKMDWNHLQETPRVYYDPKALED